jgi:hypothetical protein
VRAEAADKKLNFSCALTLTLSTDAPKNKKVCELVDAGAVH